MEYSDPAADPEHAKALLEAWAEGCVRANMETLSRAPEGAFPCCCGCGDFTLTPLRLLPITLSPLALRVQGAKVLTAAGEGTAFDLACFQCAQRRRDGDDGAHVEVEIDEAGFLHCYVMRTDTEHEDMNKYLPTSRNCGACGCSAEEQE